MVQYAGANLSDVQAAPLPSVAEPARAPNLAAFGEAISSEIGKRKEEASAKEKASIFSEVQNEQTDLVTNFLQGGEALTPQEQQHIDTFSQLDDVERQNALQNSAVRDAYNKLQRIGQARRQPKSAAEYERLYLMAADITRRVANDHPQYADFVNQAAKKTLGFDPLEKAIGLSQAETIKQTDFERKQSQALVEKAVSAGVVDIGPDGSFDQETAQLKGQALLQQEYILKQQKDRADLASAQRRPDAEVQREKFSGYMKSVEPMIQADVAQFGASVLKLYPALADDPQSEAKIKQAWANKRAAFKAQQETYIAQIDDPKVQADVRSAIDARLKPYDDMFTGDFSALKTKTDLLSSMNKDLQIELHTAAPQTARLLALGGDQVAATVINKIVQNKSNSTIEGELTRYVEGGPSQEEGDVVSFTNVLSGATTIATLPAGQAKSTIKTSGAVLNDFSARPNDLSDQELGVYGTLATQLAAVAYNSDLPPDQLASATNMLASPSKVRIFERYATDPNADPATVATLAGGISAVALKNINAQTALLRQGTFNVPVTSLGGKIPEGGTLTGREFSNVSFTTTPVYNGDTGRFELKVPKGTPVPIEVQRRVETLNNSLEAAVTMKSYTGGREAQLDDLQYKQYLIDTSGQETIGTRAELPDGPKQPTSQATTPAAPKTSAEMVDELIRLGKEGDRAAIAALLRGGQGATNPSQPLQGDLNAKINAVASESGVDASLLSALVQQESGGNPSARSSKGAVGLTQLMPGTAEELGVDPNDPDQNLMGGAVYLKQQLDRFGDVRKALAAYNAGPARVARLIEKFGDEWDQHLPAETENYIKSITGGL